LDNENANGDLIDDKVLSQGHENHNGEKPTKRKMSPINIHCDPDLPFGKYFNRELVHMKQATKIKNTLIDDVFGELMDIKNRVLYKYVTR
jgi:hypothetical protein